MNTNNTNKNLLVQTAERIERYNLLIEKIVEYKEKNGSFRGITQDPEIGVKVMNLRASYKNSNYHIPDVITAKLKEIGFPFVVRKQDWFTPFYEKLIQYKQVHKGFYKITTDPEIGTLVNQLRQAKKGNNSTYKLSQDMIDKLNAINFPWEHNRHEWFEEFYAKLMDYKRINGSFAHIVKDKEIGRIVTKIRSAKKAKNDSFLTNEMIEKLNAIDFVWEEVNKDWFTPFYEKLIAYKEKHGNFNGVICDKEIGSTVSNIRSAKKGMGHTKLTQEMIDKLDEIGFYWEAKHKDWFYTFVENLIEYKNKRGSFDGVTYDSKLGYTVSVVRYAYKGNGRTKLTQEMIDILNNIGFNWTADKSNWFDSFYKKLVEYKKINGSFYGVTQDKEIGPTVGNIRAAYKGKGKIKLTESMIKKLDEIDFTWTAEQKYPIHKTEEKVFD